jgi:hypothetical protein
MALLLHVGEGPYRGTPLRMRTPMENHMMGDGKSKHEQMAAKDKQQRQAMADKHMADCKKQK